MKTKDVICIVGAPARTIGEIVLWVGIVGGFALGFIFVIYHIPIPHFPAWLVEAGSIGLFCIVGVMGIVVLIMICNLVLDRTRDNYNSCKRYWNK